MNIKIDERQRAVLHTLVETRLSSLGSEIRHTDTPRVRDELRDEREALRELLPKFSVSARGLSGPLS